MHFLRIFALNMQLLSFIRDELLCTHILILSPSKTQLPKWSKISNKRPKNKWAGAHFIRKPKHSYDTLILELWQRMPCPAEIQEQCFSSAKSTSVEAAPWWEWSVQMTNPFNIQRISNKQESRKTWTKWNRECLPNNILHMPHYKKGAQPEEPAGMPLSAPLLMPPSSIKY